MEAIGSVGRIVTVMDDYTVLPTDRIILLNVCQDFTVTLPNPAACPGYWYSLYDMINLDPADEVTISIADAGAFVRPAGLTATIQLNAAGAHLQVFSADAAWYVISEAT